MDAVKMGLQLEQHGASFIAPGRTRLQLSIKSEWYQNVEVATSSNANTANTAKGGPMDSCFFWR